MMDALEYERAYVEESLSKGLEIPPVNKTQQYLANQSSITTRQSTKKKQISFFKYYFLFIDRSISAILRTSNSPCSNHSLLLTTAVDHTPLPRRKSSLPRFVRCSSPDSSIDESFRSIKSRFRFWS